MYVYVHMFVDFFFFFPVKPVFIQVAELGTYIRGVVLKGECDSAFLCLGSQSAEPGLSLLGLALPGEGRARALPPRIGPPWRRAGAASLPSRTQQRLTTLGAWVFY